MQLHEVTWSDLNGDQYEGLLLGKLVLDLSIAANGIVLNNITKTINSTYYVVIKTHTSSRSQQLSGHQSYGKLSKNELATIIRCYGVTLAHSQIQKTFARLGYEDDWNPDQDLCVFDEPSFRITRDFDPLMNFSAPSKIVRLLAQYAYTLEILRNLRVEYGDREDKSVLLDQQWLRLGEFLGNKASQFREYVEKMGKNNLDLIDSYEKFLDFYL